MRLPSMLLLLGLAVCGTASAQPFDHSPLDRTLRAHVDSLGRVDYAALARDHALLEAYTDTLARVSPRSDPVRFPRRQDALAYWINAYNALVLSRVVAAYPVKSVEQIGGLDDFFRRQRHVVGGDSLTLDEIESGIIRPEFSDPRIHFAVNCAARSCPALDSRAYRGDDLDGHLDRQTRRFATDTQHVRFDGKRLHVSKLLDWYRQDFTGADDAADGFVDFLRPYLPAAVTRQIRPGIPIVFFEYDWALNDQRSFDGEASFSR